MSGLRLKAARLVMGVDRQDSMAALLGVETSAYNNWERGYRLPDVAAIVRLFGLTGIGPDWIYAGSLRAVPYGLAEELKQLASNLGAVIDGPIAEWPMAVPKNQETVRPSRKAAAVPAPQSSRSFHDFGAEKFNPVSNQGQKWK